MKIGHKIDKNAEELSKIFRKTRENYIKIKKKCRKLAENLPKMYEKN